MQYTLIKSGETANITVIANGEVKVATDSHPYWNEIVAGAIADDEAIFDLFELTSPVARKLEPLTNRISVANGRVYFDGDEINNALTEQIVRFVREDVEDWLPLANFYEKVMTNLNEHSREQLFEWIEHQDLRITPEGNFTAYKGVAIRPDGRYVSIHSGTAFVDGQEVTGQIPNAVGSVISMPRSAVQHDPSVGCHTGLHAGTWNYASDFAHGAVLEVEIDPADVVSVPTDCNAQKLRVSKYLVRGVKEQKESSVVVDYDEDNDFEDDDFQNDNDYYSKW